MKSIRNCVAKYGDAWRLYAPKAFKKGEYSASLQDNYVMNSVAKRAYMLKIDANVKRFK